LPQQISSALVLGDLSIYERKVPPKRLGNESRHVLPSDFRGDRVRSQCSVTVAIETQSKIVLKSPQDITPIVVVSFQMLLQEKNEVLFADFRRGNS